ncbi:MAG: hypothetical protein ACREM3_04340 [Candidatus Rokuibacteriota bacterium]
MRPDAHAGGHVVVVRPDQPELAEYLRRRLAADPTIEVVIDRRRADRRRGGGVVAADRRRAERRHAPRGAAAAFDMPLIARGGAGHDQPAPRRIEETGAMEPESSVPRESIDRWVVEGRALFARLVEEGEAQRRRAEAAEHECEKIRQEAGLLEREVDALRREVEQLQGQQAEVVETFMRLLSHTDQMLRPVSDLLERLKRGPRAVP